MLRVGLADPVPRAPCPVPRGCCCRRRSEILHKKPKEGGVSATLKSGAVYTKFAPNARCVPCLLGPLRRARQLDGKGAESGGRGPGAGRGAHAPCAACSHLAH